MSQKSALRPLSENAGLAFPGAVVPAGLIVGGEKAHRMFAARNRHGKPNSDVLRPYVDADDFPSHKCELPRWTALPATRFSAWHRLPADDLRLEAAATSARWGIDFPADLSPEEASLYEAPFAVFRRARGVLHRRADPMRIAIARIDTFLAATLGRAPRGFVRFDSAALPGAGLVVVATDDDFLAAVLQSGVFAAWVAAHGGRLRVRHVAAFPFPWPPRKGRSELTRAQLELRDAVVRASEDDLDEAIAAAYGWRKIENEADLAARLHGLHARRLVS